MRTGTTWLELNKTKITADFSFSKETTTARGEKIWKTVTAADKAVPVSNVS